LAMAEFTEYLQTNSQGEFVEKIKAGSVTQGLI